MAKRRPGGGPQGKFGGGSKPSGSKVAGKKFNKKKGGHNSFKGKRRKPKDEDEDTQFAEVSWALYRPFKIVFIQN